MYCSSVSRACSSSGVSALHEHVPAELGHLVAEVELRSRRRCCVAEEALELVAALEPRLRRRDLAFELRLERCRGRVVEPVRDERPRGSGAFTLVAFTGRCSGTGGSSPCSWRKPRMRSISTSGHDGIAVELGEDLRRHEEPLLVVREHLGEVLVGPPREDERRPIVDRLHRREPRVEHRVGLPVGEELEHLRMGRRSDGSDDRLRRHVGERLLGARRHLRIGVGREHVADPELHLRRDRHEPGRDRGLHLLGRVGTEVLPHPLGNAQLRERDVGRRAHCTSLR